MSNRKIVLALAGVAAGLLAAATAAAAGVDADALPRCWKVTSTYQAGPAELEGFGRKFDATLESLTNTKIDAAGIPLQVNVVTCADPDGAARVHAYFMTAQGATPTKYVLHGNTVTEFLCDNDGVRAKMQDLMGVYPHDVLVYRVRVEVAPLAKSDDTRWNALFNAALDQARDPDDPAAVEKLLSLAPAFTFSDRLVLQNERPEWGAPEYSFSVQPASQTPKGDLLEVTFPSLPRTADVPRVTVDATVPVVGFSVYVPPEPVNAYNLTRSTDSWPVTRRELLKAFDEGGWDPSWPFEQKVEYLLCWVNEHIEYGGEEVGSRYGTMKTFEQAYGHCWDKSDLLVTLCRRADIPAREVMGWFLGINQGHVWVQVYDAASGWVSVDATASWTGVDARYIPLFILENGNPPFVYTSMLEIAGGGNGQRKTGDTR